MVMGKIGTINQHDTLLSTPWLPIPSCICQGIKPVTVPKDCDPTGAFKQTNKNKTTTMKTFDLLLKVSRQNKNSTKSV